MLHGLGGRLARVACVTPVRRLEGREVTTLDGLPDDARRRWADALVATGGSQCGFCTPGIVMRLAALGGRGTGGPAHRRTGPHAERIAGSLLAHLCRCTGWQTIEEARRRVSSDPPGDVADPVDRDLGGRIGPGRARGGRAPAGGPGGGRSAEPASPTTPAR